MSQGKRASMMQGMMSPSQRQRAATIEHKKQVLAQVAQPSDAFDILVTNVWSTDLQNKTITSVTFSRRKLFELRIRVRTNDARHVRNSIWRGTFSTEADSVVLNNQTYFGFINDDETEPKRIRKAETYMLRITKGNGEKRPQLTGVVDGHTLEIPAVTAQDRRLLKQLDTLAKTIL